MPNWFVPSERLFEAMFRLLGGMPWPITGVLGLMGGVMLTPWLTPFWFGLPGVTMPELIPGFGFTMPGPVGLASPGPPGAVFTPLDVPMPAPETEPPVP